MTLLQRTPLLICKAPNGRRALTVSITAVHWGGGLTSLRFPALSSCHGAPVGVVLRFTLQVEAVPRSARIPGSARKKMLQLNKGTGHVLLLLFFLAVQQREEGKQQQGCSTALYLYCAFAASWCLQSEELLRFSSAQAAQALRSRHAISNLPHIQFQTFGAIR